MDQRCPGWPGRTVTSELRVDSLCPADAAVTASLVTLSRAGSRCSGLDAGSWLERPDLWSGWHHALDFWIALCGGCSLASQDYEHVLSFVQTSTAICPRSSWGTSRSLDVGDGTRCGSLSGILDPCRARGTLCGPGPAPRAVVSQAALAFLRALPYRHSQVWLSCFSGVAWVGCT